MRPTAEILYAACLIVLVSATCNIAAAQTPEYVGSDTCVACHDQHAADLQHTPHGKLGFDKLSDQGCETCHGPGSVHVEDPERVETQPTLASQTPAEQAAQCQQCHSGGDHFFWEGSRHASRGVTCIDCHSVHAFQSERGQLKTVREPDTCFSCHADVRADSMRASHHPVREGRITCADCHTPHGAADGGNISAESINEKCYECHMEKRGPFIWEHAPVRESCLNCHTPHGSNHQKLQRTSTPYLCQQCHSNTRHPGTLYDAESLPGASRASNRAFNRACVNCHPAIHGSNHPSGPYLGR